jgi:hypothetical protein
MKLTLLTTAICLTPLAIVTPLRAENPEHVKQLLQTKSCEGCDLSGANLSGANLSFAVLVGANLRGANLSRANLSQADLTRANLSQANFQSAILDRAYLTNANLDRTNLVGASLDGTRGLPIVNPPIAKLPVLPSSLPRLTIPPPSRSSLPRLNLPSFPPLPRSTPIPLQPSTRLMPSLPTAPVLSKPIPAPPPILPKQETNTPSQSSEQSENIYPPRLVEIFMNSCTQGQEGKIRDVNIEQVCTCSINKIQKEYTLTEFLNISLDMADKKEPPERIVKIALECAFENLPPSQESKPISLSRGFNIANPKSNI